MTRVASDDESSIRWAQQVRTYELGKSTKDKNIKVLKVTDSIPGVLSQIRDTILSLSKTDSPSNKNYLANDLIN